MRYRLLTISISALTLCFQGALAADNTVLITYNELPPHSNTTPHEASVEAGATLYEEVINLAQARHATLNPVESDVISFATNTEFVVLKNDSLTRFCRKESQANVIFGRPKADTYCLEDKDEDGLFDHLAHFKSDQRFASDATFHPLKQQVSLGDPILDHGDWMKDHVLSQTAGKRIAVKKLKKGKITIDLEIGTTKGYTPPSDKNPIKYRSYKQKKTFKESELPQEFTFHGAQIKIFKNESGEIKALTTQGFEPFVTLNEDGTNTIHGRTGGFYIATY